YLAAGRRSEARRILEEAIKRGQDQRVYPMFYYTLGYLYQQDGDLEPARGQYALGAKGGPAFVLPHRVEEIKSVTATRETTPNDARAAYYLGNVLASFNRDKEALTAWKFAASDNTSIIARRNFARALWVVEGNKDEAAKEYQSAISTTPNEFRLYIEFDRLL